MAFRVLPVLIEETLFWRLSGGTGSIHYRGANGIEVELTIPADHASVQYVLGISAGVPAWIPATSIIANDGAGFGTDFGSSFGND